MKTPATLVLMVTVFIYTICRANQDNCGQLITDFSQQICINKGDENRTYFYWKDGCIPYCRQFETQGKFKRLLTFKSYVLINNKLLFNDSQLRLINRVMFFLTYTFRLYH